MASDLNRVLLVGRLTRDPELRSTPTGSVVCRFSIASNRSYSNKEGERKEEVGYFDCSAWGKLGEIISKYVVKGRRIGLDGYLRWSQWENQEGKKQSKIEITVDNFQFLDSRGAAMEGEDFAGASSSSPSNQESRHNQESQKSQETSSPSTSSDIINDDDIPF